jgi:hypothetical protein
MKWLYLSKNTDHGVEITFLTDTNGRSIPQQKRRPIILCGTCEHRPCTCGQPTEPLRSAKRLVLQALQEGVPEPPETTKLVVERQKELRLRS